MAASSAPGWSSREAQEYAAAESMLQHSRSARSNAPNLNGFAIQNVHNNYTLPGTQPQAHVNNMDPVHIQPYGQMRSQFQPPIPQEHAQAFTTSPHELHPPFDQQPGNPISDQHSGQNFDTPRTGEHNQISAAQIGQGQRNSGSIQGSESASPVSTRSFTKRQGDDIRSWTHRPSNIALAQTEIKDEMGKKPPWSELKTKAGKERKRLPLACIACRRKKIRCSGEKPSCKHCMRARIPCVYKVTARKAAPRTDYMAMLDKRLKRMEERVIKIIPKDDLSEPMTIPRAIIKPSAPGSFAAGKKRGAEEAFGSQMAEWMEAKNDSALTQGQNSDENTVNTEGADLLPSQELQDHLSETFFDNLYGQSYHLLHKPSYMRRLRAGTVPPVLVLAICATSARFSTHPQCNSEPAFLRGEAWAKPARELALRRYDQPNITTLTVLLLLGLHEFGTCQGGRSWMFAGMATRMAYALQLHRELDHDPLGQKKDKKTELSFTDREIRRRTMWACFLMDRFNSSGTERPMFADEDMIKVQLPIKESKFQMEEPGPTESLDGRVPNPVKSDNGQLEDPKANMGVAAHFVRVVALWGRVIKYLNMGGKERDRYAIWEPESQFAALRREATDFKLSLPSSLENNQENIRNHGVEKLANQFLLLHVALNQVILFLHRFAIPTAPGGRNPKEMPKSFLAEAAPYALEAANEISLLINETQEHRAIAPFLGYCAFLSSTVHVWGMYSKKPALVETCRRHLGYNVRYLEKMKKYWGMFHFMTENLKDIYRQHADASMDGSSETTTQDATIFQYGDWFGKYPHGVSGTDLQEPPDSGIKKESDGDSSLSQNSDLRSVEDFFRRKSPPSKAMKPNRSFKSIKITPHTEESDPQMQQHAFQPDAAQQRILPLPLSKVQSPMDPSSFSTPQNPQNPQLYPHPCNNSYPGAYDLLPLSTPANTAVLPQLDRQLVYGAYAGHDPTGSSSASALSALTNSLQDPSSQAMADPSSQMWDNPLELSPQQQEAMLVSTGTGAYLGDIHSSAWFMPFNLNPPEFGDSSIGGDEFSRGLDGNWMNG